MLINIILLSHLTKLFCPPLHNHDFIENKFKPIKLIMNLYLKMAKKKKIPKMIKKVLIRIDMIKGFNGLIFLAFALCIMIKNLQSDM